MWNKLLHLRKVKATRTRARKAARARVAQTRAITPLAATKVQPAAPHAQSTPNSSDDGSSPLVPILIAAAVLAAISIAALLIRQRRQRDGSSPSLSTKAG